MSSSQLHYQAYKLLLEKPRPITGWSQIVLMLAAAYNILFGIWAGFFPFHYFSISGMQQPLYPGMWQCVGMIVGLYGLGYLIASSDIIRYWPLVFIGLLGKIFGPIGFLTQIYTQQMPVSAAWILITNDFIWWLPFYIILKEVWLRTSEIRKDNTETNFVLERYESLLERSHKHAQLLVFVRHFGCTFCRQVLKDLAHFQRLHPDHQARVTLVHMGSEKDASEFIEKLGVRDVGTICDNECLLYELFGLGKATLWQAFGPAVWRKAWNSFVREQCYVGALKGDGYQLGGAFFIKSGQIVDTVKSSSVAETVPFQSLFERNKVMSNA